MNNLDARCDKIDVNDIYFALYGKQSPIHKTYFHHDKDGNMIREKQSHVNIGDINIGLFLYVGASGVEGVKYYKHIITGKIYQTASVNTVFEEVVIKKSVTKLHNIWPDYVDTVNRNYKGKVTMANVCKIEQHLKIKLKDNIKRLNIKSKEMEKFERRVEMLER